MKLTSLLILHKLNVAILQIYLPKKANPTYFAKLLRWYLSTYFTRKVKQAYPVLTIISSHNNQPKPKRDYQQGTR
ncbi:hypothetical protein GCM10028808_53440 [Spirosoma migulaei]